MLINRHKSIFKRCFLNIALLSLSTSCTVYSSSSFQDEKEIYFDYCSLDNGCCIVKAALPDDCNDYQLYKSVKNLEFPAFSPSGEKVIDAYVDAYFPKLETIVLPNTLINIGKNAFSNLLNLKKINIPDRVRRIEDGAFENDESLEYVDLPKVRYVGEKAFSNCINLQTVKFPFVKEIKDSAFEECRKLINVNFPVLENVGYASFESAKSLISLTIPKSVKTINACAFSNCDKLSLLTIEDGVEKIEKYAFDLSNIEKVFLPKSVAYLGESAFFNSHKLITIFCEAESKPEGWYDKWNEQKVSFVWNTTRKEFNQLLQDGEL